MDETGDNSLSSSDSNMQLTWIKIFVICGLIITSFSAACLPLLLFKRYGRSGNQHQQHTEVGQSRHRFRDFIMSCLPRMRCWNKPRSNHMVSENGKLGSTTRNSNSSKLVSVVNCFSGGVFLGTSFLALMPEIREIFDGVGITWPVFYSFNNTYIKGNSTDIATDEETGGVMMPITEILVTCGLFLVLCIEQGVHAITDRDAHANKKSSTNNNNTHSNGNAIAMKTMNETATTSVSNDARAGEDRDWDTNAEVPESKTLLIAYETEPNYTDSQPTNIVKVTVVTPTSEETISETVTENNLLVDAESPGKEPPEEHTESHDDSNVRSLMLVSILSIHSLLEGLAIGLQSKASSALSIFFAVLFHKSLMAFSMGNNLVQSKQPTKLILLAAFVLACMSPVGIIIGIVMKETKSGTEIVHGVLQGIATGTFLFITFFEVLSKEFSEHSNRVYKTVSFILGYGCILAVMFVQHGA